MTEIDIKKVLDGVFWDLSDGTVVSRVLDILQKGVYSPIFENASKLYDMLFPHRATDLEIYKRVFGVANRTAYFSGDFKDFEVFRMKVLCLWLASMYVPSVWGLNLLVGGFTAQPVFYERIADNVNYSWWLGHSYLDGNAGSPDIYKEPRTWLRSVFGVATGYIIEVFSEEVPSQNLLAHPEEYSEFLYWLRRFSPPVQYYVWVRKPREPVGYKLWGLGYGEPFDLVNMERSGIFYNLNADAVSTNFASLITSVRSVDNGVYIFSIFDIFLSDRLSRRIFYKSGGDWIEVFPFGLITVADGTLQFKIELRDIVDVIDYRFVSMMIKGFGV